VNEEDTLEISVLDNKRRKKPDRGLIGGCTLAVRDVLKDVRVTEGGCKDSLRYIIFALSDATDAYSNVHSRPPAYTPWKDYIPS
jgi:hypothetical protein